MTSATPHCWSSIDTSDWPGSRKSANRLGKPQRRPKLDVPTSSPPRMGGSLAPPRVVLDHDPYPCPRVVWTEPRVPLRHNWCLMRPELVDVMVKAMDSVAFENLVFALVRDDEPMARQLRPPDGGRDTIVPASDARGELVWQAKHYTSRIYWDTCERSLKKALAKRSPEEFTFVFAVNLSESDEDKLEELREKYRGRVTLPDPWTLGTLREMLAKKTDVRREQIERPWGIYWDFERASLERLAGLKEGWDTLRTAAMQGSLAVLGIKADLLEAEAAVERGELDDASLRFEAMAQRAIDSMPAVADVLLLRAATCAGEAGERARAGELHLRVSRSAALRGDDTAEYAASRASWELAESEQWRSSAATARAVWTEHPQEAIPVLRGAFDRSIDAGDLGGVAEWGETCCEALSAREDWRTVVEVAQRAVKLLGPLQEAGARLAIELDHLEARSALGEDVEHEFHELLLTPVGREDENSAWIRARLGAIRAHRGEATGASLAFVEAAERWAVVGDVEDEIAEAIFSQDAVGQLLPDAEPLDQPTRIAAADLRGRAVTAAVRADRKEVQGLRAWLEDRGADALRALMTAWAMHRRAGHLGGCMRVGTALRKLHESIEEWPDTLSWAIRTGNYQAAREAAGRLTWPLVAERLRVEGAQWERGPSFEAIAVAGASASDSDIGALVEPLLTAARDHDGQQYLSQHPAPAARRALSKILCVIDEQHFPPALDEVIYETENCPFPPSDSTEGVLLATEAGLCDATLLIAEIACIYSPSHVRSLLHAQGVIERSIEAVDHVERLAQSKYTPLVVAAQLRLPDRFEPLAERAADITARFVRDELEPDEIVTHYHRGLLARWASGEDQAAVARDLATVIGTPSHLDAHRHESADGLAALAPALAPECASEMLDQLQGVGEQIAIPSTTIELRSHRNRHLARSKMHAPAAGAAVRAAALGAAYALAMRSDRTHELDAAIADARADSEEELRRRVVHIAREHPDQLVGFDLLAMLDDPDVGVRAAALAACVHRGVVSAEHPLVAELSGAGQPLAVRATILKIARGSPADYRAALERLAEDPHVFIRSSARHSLFKLRSAAP